MVKSITDAIDAYNSANPKAKIEQQYKTHADMRTAGIGRTLFFAYNEENGYRIETLGWGYRVLAWISRLFRHSCCCSKKETHLTPVQKFEVLAALTDKSFNRMFSNYADLEADIGNSKTLTPSSFITKVPEEDQNAAKAGEKAIPEFIKGFNLNFEKYEYLLTACLPKSEKQDKQPQ